MGLLGRRLLFTGASYRFVEDRRRGVGNLLGILCPGLASGCDVRPADCRVPVGSSVIRVLGGLLVPAPGSDRSDCEGEGEEKLTDERPPPKAKPPIPTPSHQNYWQENIGKVLSVG